MLASNGSHPAPGNAAPAGGLEIVDDEKPAFQQVVAQRRRPVVGQRPPADLDDVGHRILEQFGVFERQRVEVLVVRAEIDSARS